MFFWFCSRLESDPVCLVRIRSVTQTQVWSAKESIWRSWWWVHVYAYGLKTVRVKRCFLLPCFFCYGGVGWGGDDDVSWVYLALAHMWDATQLMGWVAGGVGMMTYLVKVNCCSDYTYFFHLFPGVQKLRFLEFVYERNVSSISGSSAFRVFCFWLQDFEMRSLPLKQILSLSTFTPYMSTEMLAFWSTSLSGSWSILCGSHSGIGDLRFAVSFWSDATDFTYYFDCRLVAFHFFCFVWASWFFASAVTVFQEYTSNFTNHTILKNFNSAFRERGIYNMFPQF